MKHFASYALSFLLVCSVTTGFSQSNSSKPKQFNNFPDLIDCSEQQLSGVFTATPGQHVNLAFSNNFIFSGTLTSNLVKYSNLQTAIVVSPDYANTVFAISKITGANGSISYNGRIINKNYFDGFELKKNTAGNYQLIKIETDRVIQDCF